MVLALLSLNSQYDLGWKEFFLNFADTLCDLFFLCFNPLYIGGLFHCYMLDLPFVILGVLGVFCHFYSIFDGKSYY